MTTPKRIVSILRALLPRLVALGVAALISLVLAEGVLRLLRSPNRFYPYHPNSTRAVFPTERVTPGVSGPSYFTTNSYGTRGPELSGQPIRILTIGGSTTACAVLDDSEEWPALLMSYLNDYARENRVWVTNSGINGHNSHHHLMHAKYLLPELPRLDYVIVYAGLNDVGMWLYVKNWDPNYLDDPDHWNSRIGEAFRVSNYTPADFPWYKRLELWKRASIVKDRVLSLRVEHEREEGRIVEDSHLEWMVREQQRRNAAEKRFVHRAKMDTLSAALDSYERNLMQIAEHIREAGAEPVFMAQAMDIVLLDEEERRRLWMGAMDGGEAYVRGEQLRELVEAYNRRMQDVAERAGALFVDLPALLSDQRGLFYDGHHLNEHGARVVARAVADFLWEARLADRGHPEPERP